MHLLYLVLLACTTLSGVLMAVGVIPMTLGYRWASRFFVLGAVFGGSALVLIVLAEIAVLPLAVNSQAFQAVTTITVTGYAFVSTVLFLEMFSVPFWHRVWRR